MLQFYRDANLTLPITLDSPKRFLLPLNGRAMESSVWLGDPDGASGKGYLFAGNIQVFAVGGGRRSPTHPAAGRRQGNRLGIAPSGPSPCRPRADLTHGPETAGTVVSAGRGSLHPAQVRASRART